MIVNNILIVGSSIAIEANASGFSKSAIVSPISKPSTPTIAQISPAITSVTFLRPRPSKVCNSLIRDFTTVPSLFTNEIGIASFNIPLSRRPIAIRPVKAEKSREVINICGVPSDTFGAGTFSITISNNASTLSVTFSQWSDIQLFLAEP